MALEPRPSIFLGISGFCTSGWFTSLCFQVLNLRNLNFKFTKVNVSQKVVFVLLAGSQAFVSRSSFKAASTTTCAHTSAQQESSDPDSSSPGQPRTSTSLTAGSTPSPGSPRLRAAHASLHCILDTLKPSYGCGSKCESVSILFQHVKSRINCNFAGLPVNFIRGVRKIKDIAAHMVFSVPPTLNYVM